MPLPIDLLLSNQSEISSISYQSKSHSSYLAMVSKSFFKFYSLSNNDKNNKFFYFRDRKRANEVSEQLNIALQNA